VPYVVRGADRFFERPEVKQALTLLRGAARSDTGPAEDVNTTVTAVLSSMGWSDAAPSGPGRARDRWESLQALIALTQELTADDRMLTLPGLVAELHRRADAQHAPVAAGITLATLHSAKGLEWSHVFCVGMHEGMMPIVYADTVDAVEEECRLLYVGMTRARDRLAVSWSAARTPGARGSRGPSRFLAALVTAPRTGAGGERRRRQRGSAGRGLQTCRVCGRPLTDARERKLGHCIGCPTSYDDALFESLRDWRRQRAKEENVPAFCVFTDATLTALAEIRPADNAELIAVPGVGKAKIDKYGADILGLCASHRSP
jgi:DNA helicase-2/ATP-dependent DNA helicase PcrA